MCNYITHTDADGIISALLYKHHTKHKFIGFYGFWELKTFLLTQKINKKEDIGIDLDLDFMKSIGHHVNPINNELSDNPNNRYIKGLDFYKKYSEKCPLNTVMLLLSKYNYQSLTDRQLALTVFADGFFVYYKKYTPNCKNWLDRYNLSFIYEDYDKKEDVINKIISEEIVPIFSTRDKYNDLYVKVKDKKISNKEEIYNFSKYVIDEFNLDAEPDMFDLDYKIHYDFNVIKIDFETEEQYKNIVRLLNGVKQEDLKSGKDAFVSSAMTYKKEIKITEIGDHNILEIIKKSP